MEDQQTEKFECYAIVELMGHSVLAGYVSERVIGGAALIQVDVPQVDEQHPAFTKLVSASAIYAITPTSEQHAREAAAQIRVRPVTLYILPEAKRLEARAEQGYAFGDDLRDDDNDDDEEIPL